MAHPTGTVTFLFSDIEGSTKIARGHPETWEILRARHHHILRQAIEASNGFIFEIVGDAFCAAFHSIDHAIQAAVKTQTDLGAEDWGDAPIRVRIGIHTGKADLQSTGLYLGYMTLSHVQRLMSAGHGGQTLLSATGGPLALENLPPGITLRDLGECRLKDMPLPEHIFQLVIPDLRSDFPPLRTLESFPNNLPVQLTSFIGRRKEINDIKRLFQHVHLITLLGPGGTGKSRLGLEAAGRLLSIFPHGVWLVDLAPVTDPSAVEGTTLAALNLPPELHRPAIDMLCDYLHDKDVLILLDNCEHLLESTARMVNRLLQAAPGLRILASSREALGITGEVAYRVPSLTIPDPLAVPSSRSLQGSDSVKLFLDRAAAASPAFTLSDENAPAIVQICCRLDGIPLALELAAARVSTLSAGQIAARLDDRFRLLTGGSRIALERHQTLLAALDWSFNLLSPPEQLLFTRLSVFVGGWTLEAAESVCAGGALHRQDILDLLAHLVNKSLVVAEPWHSETRYRFLETMRQYAGEKLDEAKESENLRDQHLRYFMEFTETAEPHLTHPEQLEWFDRLDADHDNLRAALEWSLGKESPEFTLRLCAALGQFWLVHSYLLEGAHYLQRALEAPPGTTGESLKTSRVHALFQDAKIANQLDYLERLTASAEEALALCESGVTARDLAIARFWIGVADTRAGDFEAAQTHLQICLAEFQMLGDPYWEAQTRLGLMQSFVHIIGQTQESTEEFTRGLEAARTAGDRWLLSQFLFYGAVGKLDHDQDEAEAYLREMTSLDGQLRSSSLTPLLEGVIAHSRNDLKAARVLYLKFQEEQKLLGERNARSYSLQFLVGLERDAENFELARSYAEEALGIAQEMGDKGRIGVQLAWLAHIEFFQEDLMAARRDLRAGLAMLRETEVPVQRPAPLLVSAWFLADENPRLAICLLGAVQASHEDGAPLDVIARKDFDYVISQAGRHMDETEFAAAWSEGKSITLDEALDLAIKALDEM